jgi:hypothetical protein
MKKAALSIFRGAAFFFQAVLSSTSPRISAGLHQAVRLPFRPNDACADKYRATDCESFADREALK